MLVTSGDSEPSELRFVVVEAPPPSLDPIRVADLEAGESRTLDLARYLRPGVSNPEPTVVEVSQITDLDVRIAKEGDSGITITTGDQVDGRAEFRVRDERRLRLLGARAAGRGPDRGRGPRRTRRPDRTGARQRRARPGGAPHLARARTPTALRSTATASRAPGA